MDKESAAAAFFRKNKTKVEKELITLFRKDFFVHTAAANKRK